MDLETSQIHFHQKRNNKIGIKTILKIQNFVSVEMHQACVHLVQIAFNLNRPILFCFLLLTLLFVDKFIIRSLV